MNAVQLIRTELELSAQITLQLIEDMRDAPLTFPTPRGGNHPLWVLGHMAFVEGDLVQHQMLGKPNPVADWRGLFSDGTEPVADADAYPHFDELLAAFQSLRAKTLEYLSNLSDSDLDTPPLQPRPGFEQFLATRGMCLAIVVFNTLMHRGQVADARRALGRKPLTA